jgi:hypothetical protein
MGERVREEVNWLIEFISKSKVNKRGRERGKGAIEFSCKRERNEGLGERG